MYIKIPKNKIDRIEIVKTNCKMTLTQVVDKYKPDYVINGGLYSMKTGRVSAIPLRINGKTVATSKYGYWMMTWNKGSDICMDHSTNIDKWQSGVACSSMLKDGQNTAFCFTSAQGGTRGRTAIGDDDENLHLFVTTDTNGALSPYTLRDKMKASGCKNAIMLDCGGSSQMYATGKYYQAEKRMVSYWICVWLKKSTTVKTPETSDKTPSKTPSKCPFKEPTSSVKIGSTGEVVKWVQWYLKATVAPELPIDGTFYTKTRTAVIEFQKKYGLLTDGIVGSGTRSKMKEVVK